MESIDNWARRNGMTPEEFKREVFTSAAAIGAMEIDKRGDDGEALRFTCADSVGGITVYIKRDPKPMDTG